MRARHHIQEYVTLISCLVLISVLLVPDTMGQLDGCPFPVTFAEVGAADVARWGVAQQVNVVFYAGDFTADERNAIKSVLQEFESPVFHFPFCAKVQFTGFTEGIFTKPWGTAANTYYISKVGLDALPTAAGDTGTRSGNQLFQNR